MSRTLLLASLLLAPPALAQTVPDTTAPARYFPLAIGNTWEYTRTGAFPGLSWLERRAVVGDTLVDGETYVRYQVDRFDDAGQPLDEGFTWLLRYDPATASIVTTEPPLPALTGCPLDAPFGAEMMCADDCFTSVFGGVEDVGVGEDTLHTSVKYFDSHACEVTGAYAADLGFIGYDSFGGSMRLGYARVGGAEFGAPVIPSGTGDGRPYFPLMDGAVWEYVGEGILTGTLQRRSVVGDTLVGGETYARFRVEEFDAATGAPTAPAEHFALRYDSLTTALDAPDGLPFGVTPCALGVAPPDTLNCPDGCTVTVSGGEEEIVVGSDVVVVPVKHYDSQACEVLSHYAAGIGFLGYRLRAAGYQLAYARVGDVELGAPVVPVAAEPSPPTAALRLSAAPNPAAGPVTLWLDLPRPQAVRVEVLDALGRRIARLHDGPLGAGLHPLVLDAALPAGLYVVRATAGGAQATRRITLVR